MYSKYRKWPNFYNPLTIIEPIPQHHATILKIMILSSFLSSYPVSSHFLHNRYHNFQVSLDKCGVGAHLYFNACTCFIFKYGARIGSNNRVQFFSLWTLLKIVADKGINKIHVLWDSNLIVELENRRIKIENLSLNHIKNKILAIRN